MLLRIWQGKEVRNLVCGNHKFFVILHDLDASPVYDIHVVEAHTQLFCWTTNHPEALAKRCEGKDDMTRM